ncbi:FadR/GntR family transcriptional regulator [Priestia filamentosa]|uniref:FadR/GntR family transcriptional regulator n=1 Tax=Priestia filamentosa TaxID=1402861 RepID=UPI00397B62DB
MKKENSKKINRESVTQQVYNDLKERIIGGEFLSGEKLPSENNLAETYGVSRLSVRSALQKLNTLGLVDIRVGEGTFVQKINFGNFMNEVSNLIAQESMTKYLFEFRDNIEKTCAKLAVDRASEEEIQKLTDIANKLLIVAKNEDYDNYVELDYEFHYQLCKMSQNKLYDMVYSSIKDLFKMSIRKNIAETALLYNKDLVECAKYHIQFAEEMQKRDLQNIFILLDKIVEIRPGLDI